MSDAIRSLCAASSNEMEYRQMVGRFVDERLVAWQQRLNLQDWRVSVDTTPRKELKAKTLGNVHWDKRKRSAEIHVMDASDYRLPCQDMLSDMEMTIVHELVHLELAALPRSERSQDQEEHAVNRLAEALLKMAGNE